MSANLPQVGDFVRATGKGLFPAGAVYCVTQITADHVSVRQQQAVMKWKDEEKIDRIIFWLAFEQIA